MPDNRLLNSAAEQNQNEDQTCKLKENFKPKKERKDKDEVKQVKTEKDKKDATKFANYGFMNLNR